MPTIEYAVKTEMVTEECCNCGILFAFTKDFEERKRNDHEYFYCPRGHAQHYTGKSEAEKLKFQLDQTQGEVARIRQQRDSALLEITQKNKEINRISKRIYAGICPDCHRHFLNVERHMENKHKAVK